MLSAGTENVALTCTIRGL